MMRRFRPKSVYTFAVLALALVFLGLGVGQLQRAEEKRLLQEEYDARARDPAVRIEPGLRPAEELRFRRVTVRGYYETAHEVLVDNRMHQGYPGYHVITPLRIEGGEVRVLVNRGWVPPGESRDRLPAVDAPSGLQEISGVATVPGERPLQFAPDPPITRESWPRVWPHMDLARFRAAAPYPVQPVVVLLDPRSSAGGFTRDWSRLDAGIAVHQGYAYQWFILAALLAIYLLLRLRRPAGSGRA